MSILTIHLDNAPAIQSVQSKTFHGGQLVVGRGDDADWQIDDPDSYVSRKHFIISLDGDTPIVTDASMGGLFVDGSGEALGAGNSVPLRDGTRLRFGDFVARIAFSGAEEQRTPASSTPASSGAGGFTFGDPPEREETPPRPEFMPDPFGVGKKAKNAPPVSDPAAQHRPLDEPTPFDLDLAERPVEPGAGNKFFPSPGTPPPVDPPPQTTEYAPKPPEPPAQPAAGADLHAAFFRGMRLDPAAFQHDDPQAQMEALGKRFRALADGLHALVQARAIEKDRIRASQTVVGATNNNPLKSSADTDEALASLIVRRGPAYLAPDAAIEEGFRDIADHQMRTWAALQTALRKMIDRFDPEEIERDMDGAGLLEKLIAGGRSAMLWQLYQDRFEDIARAAEDRFLGEVGVDFRDAYEKRR